MNSRLSQFRRTYLTVTDTEFLEVGQLADHVRQRLLLYVDEMET